MFSKTKNTEERFQEKVKVVESGCHEWQSTIKKTGYGTFWLNGKVRLSHRVGYEIANGVILERKLVLHKCDNRKCVNPDHLYLGNHSDNVKDKIERYKGMWGRMKIPYETVLKIRSLCASGLSQTKVANLIGIQQSQVSRIVRKVSRINN